MALPPFYFNCMKKFFLFRKEEITVSSVTSSDVGQGISVIAIPTERLSYLSAAKGHVIAVFEGVSPYEESYLTDGESIGKATVKIPCKEGSEMDLMEDMLYFIAREGGKSIMRFDAVDAESTFSAVSFDSKIESIVRINPVKRVTGEPSTQTFLGTSGSVGADAASTTIAGIDFGISGNLPLVDYNHEGLASTGVGSQINSWGNDGTGGNTYDINSNVGTPVAAVASGTSGISEKTALLQASDHFILPTSTFSNDYVLYAVYSQGKNQAHPFYGDGDGICVGPTLGQTVENSSGEIEKSRPTATGNFSVRHAPFYGHWAHSEVIGTEDGTVSYKYPNYDVDEAERILVLIVRRDKNGNMFMYNKNSDFVSYIPAKTLATILAEGGKPTDAAHGRTDGDLKIERLGTINDITTDSFTGYIARFGVIPKDIGVAACDKLATDLYNLYKL